MEYWELLHHLQFLCFGEVHNLVRVRDDQLVSGYEPRASAYFESDAEIFHFDFTPLPCDNLKNPPPNSKVCTIRTNTQKYITCNPNTGEIFASEPPSPSVENYFFVVLNSSDKCSFSLASALNLCYVSVEKGKKLLCDVSKDEAASFSFFYKCSIKAQASTMYLTANPAKDKFTLRSPTLETPFQIFLLKLGDTCTVLSPAKNMVWSLLNDVVVQQNLLGDNTPLQMKLKKIGNAFTLSTTRDGQELFLRPTEEGYLGVSPTLDQLCSFLLQPHPKEEPTVQPSSLIDIPLQHMDALVTPQTSAKTSFNSGDLISFHSETQTQTQTKPIVEDSDQLILKFIQSESKHKMDKIFDISKQLSSTDGQIIIFCADSIFAHKISRKLYEIGCSSRCATAQTALSDFVSVTNSIRHGSARYLVLSFNVDESRFGELPEFSAIIYFDLVERESHYENVISWAKPKRIYSIITPTCKPQALFKFAASQPNIGGDSPAFLENFQSISTPVFGKPLNDVIFCIVSQWIEYMLRWHSNTSLKRTLTASDLEALRHRVEKSEQLYLDPSGSDWRVAFDLLVDFLTSLPGSLVSKEACASLFDKMPSIHDSDHGHYVLQTAIRNLKPPLNATLADKVFQLLHKISFHPIYDSMDIAKQFAPIIFASGSKWGIYSLEIIIREYRVIKQTTPYQVDAPRIVLHSSFESDNGLEQSEGSGEDKSTSQEGLIDFHDPISAQPLPANIAPKPQSEEVYSSPPPIQRNSSDGIYTPNTQITRINPMQHPSTLSPTNSNDSISPPHSGYHPINPQPIIQDRTYVSPPLQGIVDPRYISPPQPGQTHITPPGVVPQVPGVFQPMPVTLVPRTPEPHHISPPGVIPQSEHITPPGAIPQVPVPVNLAPIQVEQRHITPPTIGIPTPSSVPPQNPPSVVFQNTPQPYYPQQVQWNQPQNYQMPVNNFQQQRVNFAPQPIPQHTTQVYPLNGGVSTPRVREDWELRADEIRFEKKIGSGSFGEVWKGEWAGTVVAIKKVSSGTIGAKEINAFREEINIMTKLRHPNILQFLGACLEPDLLLVTEFAHRSSLFQVLQSRDLTWERSKKIILDTARGILYLHTRTPPIVHRDIKSLNILVTLDWKAVVADFGLTKIKKKKYLQTYCGSPAWTAPEVLRGEQYDESADVFSFGIVLWEVLSRKPPYQGVEPNVIIGKVISQPNFRPPIPVNTHSKYREYVALMAACWNDNPRMRPTFTQINEKLKTIFKYC